VRQFYPVAPALYRQSLTSAIIASESRVAIS
jgi:hypothetical protein